MAAASIGIRSGHPLDQAAAICNEIFLHEGRGMIVNFKKFPPKESIDEEYKKPLTLVLYRTGEKPREIGVIYPVILDSTTWRLPYAEMAIDVDCLVRSIFDRINFFFLHAGKEGVYTGSNGTLFRIGETPIIFCKKGEMLLNEAPVTLGGLPFMSTSIQSQGIKIFTKEDDGSVTITDSHDSRESSIIRIGSDGCMKV